jgi:dihydrofolate reductase
LFDVKVDRDKNRSGRQEETARNLERSTEMRLVATEYVTLDGVMEEPGEWSFPFFSEDAAKFKYDELFASDALLLGRVTYEAFAAAWPTMTGTGDFGERMNSLPKYVASTTLKETEWNAKLLEGDVVAAVTGLKQQPGRDLLLSGSASVFQLLMDRNLIDEYRLMVHPIVLGKGKRLFKDGMAKTILKLSDTRALASGVVVLYYEPEEART